jgi:polygalacturonase
MENFRKIRIIVILLTGLLVSVNSLVIHASSSVKYDITRFGAVGDGKTLNTLFIQAAIDDCLENGGGVVIIPSWLNAKVSEGEVIIYKPGKVSN